MNRQFSLCLALVLGSGLLGCSTAIRHHCDIHRAKVAAQSNVKLKFIKVDSEETDGVDNYGKNAVDGDPNTFWHTQWQGTSPEPPHEIVVELIPPAVIKGFAYLPRQDVSDHGVIKDYEFYVSDDREHFGRPIKAGAFDPGKGEKIETFEPIKCRFVKLRAISEINGLPWTSAAEIRVIQNGEDECAKDYWRGNIEQVSVRRDSIRPNAGLRISTSGRPGPPVRCALVARPGGRHRHSFASHFREMERLSRLFRRGNAQALATRSEQKAEGTRPDSLTTYETQTSSLMEKAKPVCINPSGYLLSRFGCPLNYKLLVTDIL